MSLDKHKTILETYNFGVWGHKTKIYRSSNRRIFISTIRHKPFRIVQDYTVDSFGLEAEFIDYIANE